MAVRRSAILADELPQHVRQDAAVPERDELLRRIDAHERLELDRRVAVADARTVTVPAGPQPVGDAGRSRSTRSRSGRATRPTAPG